MNVNPLVSIIIPCYNQAEFLLAAIHSIIDQTYENWECLIIDDGSTDNILEVINQIGSNDKIKYYAKQNGGLSNARNEGLKKAKGQYIQFLDADDFLESDKINRCISTISGSDCNLVICNFVRCNSNDSIRTPPYCDLSTITFDFENILLNWDKTFTIPIHCGFFDVEIFRECTFLEDLRAKEDWIMWLCIFLNSPKVSFVDLPLVVYREHTKSMSNNSWVMYENTAKAFQYVVSNIVPEQYKQRFFDKVNDYWKNEMQLLQKHVSNYQIVVEKLLESRSYKLGHFFLRPFKYLKSFLIPLH